MPLHPAGSPFAGLGSPPADRDVWSERLADAFADSARTTGFLALAEEAERACPGDGVILLQAAMAALLDRRPDKALVYLKRYAKRYVPGRSHRLLSGPGQLGAGVTGLFSAVDVAVNRTRGDAPGCRSPTL